MKKFLIVAVFLLIVSCSSTVTNYTPGSTIEPVTEGEIRLWHQSEKAEEAIRKSGQLLGSDEIDTYLQGIMDELFPEYRGYIRVRALKKPVLNAFAMPNGSIYINSGLLGVMQNEAQLATVLAHEGVHFLNKHSARQREHFHQAAGWMMAISMLGIPLLAEVTFASAVTGYSREHETEADLEGFKRLQRAGYQVSEARKTFEHLLREVEAEDIKAPFFFSSHPKLQARIRNFNELASKTENNGGKISQEKILNTLMQLRIDVLDKKIEKGRYNAVIAILENDGLARSYGHARYFYLGEAYRLRAEESDLEKALEQYSLYELSNGDRSVLKPRGITHLKLGNYDLAERDFKQYLNVTQDAPDRGFVEQYLRMIDKKKSGE